MRSSKIYLYAEEDVTVDDKKVSVDVSNAEVDFLGPQDIKFDFQSYKFKKDSSFYDLEVRFAALEGDGSSATNAAAITQLPRRGTSSPTADARHAAARHAAHRHAAARHTS